MKNSVIKDPLLKSEESEEYVEVQKMNFLRISAEFEDLRFKVENSPNKKVFLINMGQLKQHKPRADFSRGFFEVAGFEVDYPKGFDTVDEAVEALFSNGSGIGVICSTDDTYPEIVPELASKIKSRSKNIKLVLAGKPADDMKDVYDKSGIDDYIFMGSNCLHTLKKLAGAGE